MPRPLSHARVRLDGAGVFTSAILVGQIEHSKYPDLPSISLNRSMRDDRSFGWAPAVEGCGRSMYDLRRLHAAGREVPVDWVGRAGCGGVRFMVMYGRKNMAGDGEDDPRGLSECPMRGCRELQAPEVCHRSPAGPPSGSPASGQRLPEPPPTTRESPRLIRWRG
jgi:hypothetical protein